SVSAVSKEDRHLLCARSREVEHASEDLDLKDESFRDDAVEVKPRESVRSVGAKAARHITLAKPKEEASVEVSRAAEDLSMLGPGLHSAAFRISRSDGDVSALERLEESRHILRPVREVGVHRDDERVALIERESESFDVSATAALLLG